MNFNKKNMKKGFLPVIIIFVVAILGLGGGAYYSWTKTNSLSPVVWLKNFGLLKQEINLDGKDVVSTSTTVIPGKEKQNKETAQFYEMKAKYANKKWRGTIKGEVTTNNPILGSYTQTYTAQINEMHMIFNAPDGDSALLKNGDLLYSVALGGKAILESAHISMRDAELNVKISSFPFNLDGGVKFPEGVINFEAADPEAHQDFKVFYVYNDPEMESFYGDDEALWHIFDPANASFKFEGDKIILSAEFPNLKGDELFKTDTIGILKNTDSKMKITGELIPF